MTDFQERFKQHEKKLIETDYFQRAYTSALYNKNWKNHIDDISKIKGFKGLQALPFTSADDLRRIWEAHTIEEIILTDIVAWWYCTSGSMGNKKWIPWTYADYTRAQGAIGKIILQHLKPEDRLMSIILPPPFLSGSSPFRILDGTASLGHPIEQLAMAPEYLPDSFGLLMRRQPTAILGTPSFMLRIADEIAQRAPEILSMQSKEKKSAKLRIASAVTKVVKIKPKLIFKKMRVGFFAAEPLDPFRKAIEDLWGIEAFDIYAFTEGYGAGYECKEHNGLHFPNFNGLVEIIPEKELEKEETDPNYKPQTVIIHEAEVGLKGEIVLTDFKDALPLVRYRIRDLVEVVGIGDCNCGEDSPRLKIHGRTDNVINLGVIRLSSIIFDQFLRKDFKSGEVKLWEVLVSRDGYKPKISLTIEPEFIKNEEEFRKDLFESLHSFDIFQRGYDNELFIFDKIKFVDNLKLEIYGQGKSRTIRYDPGYFKEIKFK